MGGGNGVSGGGGVGGGIGDSITDRNTGNHCGGHAPLADVLVGDAPPSRQSLFIVTMVLQ